jgi:zona occludens toxin (predicted ATPase)
MTIIGFAGTPGSGKTYEAVKKVVDNLLDGRVIYTNIEGLEDPICQEMIKSVTGLSDLALSCQLHIFEEHQLSEFWNHIQPGCIVILDEVQKIFSSREWQSEKNKMFGHWASTHRHHGFEVVLITQNMARIDSAVRSLLEWTYVFRKINFFGGAVQKKYICYSYAGDETSGPPLVKQVRHYNDKIFRCYKSYVTSDVKELGLMKHVNVLKHPVFFIIPVVLCLTLYMVFSKSSLGTGDMFGAKKAMARYDHTKETDKPANSVPVPPAAAPYTERTPHITKIIDATGKTIFTNRIQNKGNANEKPVS